MIGVIDGIKVIGPLEVIEVIEMIEVIGGGKLEGIACYAG